MENLEHYQYIKAQLINIIQQMKWENYLIFSSNGYFYSRIANPTVGAVREDCFIRRRNRSTLYNIRTSSLTYKYNEHFKSRGDHIVSAATIYGGTINLFAVTLKKFGIECTFVDADASEEEIQKAFKQNTKVVFGETIANPANEVYLI